MKCCQLQKSFGLFHTFTTRSKPMWRSWSANEFIHLGLVTNSLWACGWTNATETCDIVQTTTNTTTTTNNGNWTSFGGRSGESSPWTELDNLSTPRYVHPLSQMGQRSAHNTLLAATVLLVESIWRPLPHCSLPPLPYCHCITLACGRGYLDTS